MAYISENKIAKIYMGGFIIYLLFRESKELIDADGKNVIDADGNQFLVY